MVHPRSLRRRRAAWLVSVAAGLQAASAGADVPDLPARTPSVSPSASAAPVVPAAPTSPTPAPPAPPTPTAPPAPSGSSAPKAPPPGDEGEEVAEEDEGPKPDATHGVLAGQVKSADGGEEVADAQVVVVGTPHRTAADFEGRWALRLPPGTYAVRVFYPGLRAQRLDHVRVVAGQRARLDVRLEADRKTAKVDVVEVEVEPDRSKAAAQLLVRRRLANASDAISAQDVARSPDRSAADAVRRVVGVTVQQGRFVYVRGLGDRYTNSLLNGAPLPSPEPDVQAIPLDIFPVGVLANLTVLKTYTPDIPADFTGGSVRINTRQLPSRFLFAVSGIAGFNSQTTMRERLTYAGGRRDWLGVDSGGRRLPGAIGGALVNTRDPAVNERQAESLGQKGRRLDPTLSPPHHTLGFVMGDRVEVAGRPLGWLVSGSFGRRFERRDEQLASYSSLDAGSLSPLFNFRGERSTETTTLSSLGTLSYQLAPGHRVGFTGLVSRRTDDEVLTLAGRDDGRNLDQRLSTARWVERALLFGQLTGEHRAGPGEVRWQVFGGQARRQEPNFTQSVDERGDGQPFVARLDDGTTHFYSSQRENSYGAGLDLEQPLDPRKDVKVKVGGLGQWKERTFGARRFRYVARRAPGCSDVLARPAASLLVPDNLGSCLGLEELTASSDSYTAEQRVLAGYVMGDVNVTRRVRLVVGTRLEAGRLALVSRNPFQPGSPEETGGYDRTDALPSASVVVALTDRSNLRLAATRTVARPQMREVASFPFQDFFNAVRVKGNPDLDRSRITNLDARYELYPTPEEVLAASVFYKHFSRPIESAFFDPSGNTRTFKNADGARNLGVELEARRSLRALAASLAGFAVVGNVSFIHSRMTLDPASRRLEGGDERPLQGQSPWVVNLALDWQSPSAATRARLAHNVLGRRIATVGSAGLPDVYEQPRHVVDASFAQSIGQHLDLKLALENLLNAPFVFRQGDKDTGRWTTGTTAWVTVTVANAL